MAELVDALDLGSCGATRKSSSLFTCTNNNFMATRTHRVLRLRRAATKLVDALDLGACLGNP